MDKIELTPEEAEIAALEKELRRMVSEDNGSDLIIRNLDEALMLITRNPHHQTSFVMDRVEGDGYLARLRVAHDRLRSRVGSKELLTYQIDWHLRGGLDHHTSYFQGSNFPEIVDKFFFEKDPYAYIIDSITLRPIS